MSDESNRHVCARCGENEVPFEPAFCGPCVFAIRAEVQDGLLRLSDYLTAWARFEEWDGGSGRLAA